ncbi:adenylate/guanylate cyclase domain-containing protein [Methylobacterium sp. 22177]|uniref:adenylate/guanylate cyclase domain-containing protein n=1 Tax=Methylobacterium sp. 22177 TaxID=3453885 RepID=UPI003F87CA62
MTIRLRDHVISLHRSVIARARNAAKGTVGFATIIYISFAIIVSATTAFVIFTENYTLKDLRQKQIRQEFEALSSLGLAKITAELGKSDVALDTLAMTDAYGFAAEETSLSLARVLGNLREVSPAAYAVFVAFPDGSYSLARRIKKQLDTTGEAIVDEHGPKFELQFTERSAAGHKVRFIYLNADYQRVVSSEPNKEYHAPQTRPWYIAGKSNSRAQLVGPYSYDDVDFVGLTLSRRSASNNSIVFGVDITLASLTDSLKDCIFISGERIMLFDTDGQLLAEASSARQGETNDLLPLGSIDIQNKQRVFERFKEHSSRLTDVMRIGDRDYLTGFYPLHSHDKKFVLINTLPESVVRLPIEQIIRMSLIAQAAIGILAFILALFIASRVSSPVHSLAEKVEKVVAFDFSQSLKVESRIFEIRRLSKAVQTLELTLKAFSSFVPSSFVKSIVDRDVSLTLGGEKRNVVVMFTDISEFTTISETMPPDRIIGQLSRYFSTISATIERHGGIVDKYIGDSVMAFWIDTEGVDVAKAACAAALEAANQISTLNKEFKSEGVPVFTTRFGLHKGEAMVGTVGALERMNYTVLGHTVNVASRIEGLNKIFGTTILISSPVKGAAGDKFRTRYIGDVTVRGASHSTTVFELVT